MRLLISILTAFVQFGPCSTSRQFVTVRPPDRKRQPPRVIQPAPLSLDVSKLAACVSYSGSPEHKNATTFAGKLRPRADATICDATFADRLQQIQLWLRTAIRMQCFAGPLEMAFRGMSGTSLRTQCFRGDFRIVFPGSTWAGNCHMTSGLVVLFSLTRSGSMEETQQFRMD